MWAVLRQPALLQPAPYTALLQKSVCWLSTTPPRETSAWQQKQASDIWDEICGWSKKYRSVHSGNERTTFADGETELYPGERYWWYWTSEVKRLSRTLASEVGTSEVSPLPTRPWPLLLGMDVFEEAQRYSDSLELFDISEVDVPAFGVCKGSKNTNRESSPPEQDDVAHFLASSLNRNLTRDVVLASKHQRAVLRTHEVSDEKLASLVHDACVDEDAILSRSILRGSPYQLECSIDRMIALSAISQLAENSSFGRSFASHGGCRAIALSSFVEFCCSSSPQNSFKELDSGQQLILSFAHRKSVIDVFAAAMKIVRSHPEAAIEILDYGFFKSTGQQSEEERYKSYINALSRIVKSIDDVELKALAVQQLQWESESEEALGRRWPSAIMYGGETIEALSAASKWASELRSVLLEYRKSEFARDLHPAVLNEKLSKIDALMQLLRETNITAR